MPNKLSYPKSRMQVLLLENVHPVAVEHFEAQGYQVESLKGALNEDELIERIKTVSILGIRSKTQVTQRVLDNAPKLLTVGAFCIGTNQIDLRAATEKGVAVFNAPYSNTRSVVELALAEMILLMRQVPDKSAQLHQGVWDKSASGSHEVRGKTLGLIGYGSIGTQLSVLAESLGMRVVFYDIAERLALGNATQCKSMREVLEQSDIVSLHVDGRASNANLIGAAELASMRDGAILINLSRGHVVDIDALRDALESGRLRGSAVDVFPYEPATNDEMFTSPLCGIRNTILTPHIGGSTLEAQENIGNFVPKKIFDFIDAGNTSNSVNFPELILPQLTNAHRVLHIHRNVPGILAQINQIFADHQINIVGQYLKTNDQIGYVITDIAAAYTDDVIQQLRSIENTIRLRLLY